MLMVNFNFRYKIMQYLLNCLIVWKPIFCGKEWASSFKRKMNSCIVYLLLKINGCSAYILKLCGNRKFYVSVIENETSVVRNKLQQMCHGVLQSEKASLCYTCSRIDYFCKPLHCRKLSEQFSSILIFAVWRKARDKSLHNNRRYNSAQQLLSKNNNKHKIFSQLNCPTPTNNPK